MLPVVGNAAIRISSDRVSVAHFFFRVPKLILIDFLAIYIRQSSIGLRFVEQLMLIKCKSHARSENNLNYILPDTLEYE